MHSVLAVKLYLFNWKRSGQIIIFTAWKEPKRTTYSIYKTGWQIGEKTALENLGMHFTSGALLVSYLAETSHWVFSATESGTLLSGLSPCPTLKMHYQKFSSTFRPPTGLKIGTRGKTALENLIVNFTGKAYGFQLVRMEWIPLYAGPPRNRSLSFSATESGTPLQTSSICLAKKMHHQKSSSTFHPPKRPTIHKWRGFVWKESFHLSYSILTLGCAKSMTGLRSYIFPEGKKWRHRTYILSREKGMAGPHLHLFWEKNGGRCWHTKE